MKKAQILVISLILLAITAITMIKYDIQVIDPGTGFPKIQLRESSPYTDQECLNAFVSEMNKRASQLGMSNSSFVTPSGLEIPGVNTSTAKDLARLGVEAVGYPALTEIWNKNSYSVRIKDESSIPITTSVTSSALENYYPILGGKTGSGAGYHTLIIVTEIEGKMVAGAIMDALSAEKRFSAMKQLFDAAKIVLQGGTPSTTAVTDASKACAYVVPQLPRTYEKDKLAILYAQNADTTTAAMSASKVLTAIIALDYIQDIHVSVEVKSFDIVEGSGAIFSAGDIVTIEDLLYALMLPSSNQAANVIARTAGEIILKSQNFLL